MTLETFTIDEIAVMSDDDLYNHMRNLHERIGQSRKERADSKLEQEDFCYFYREAKVREARRKASTAYTAAI
jgi:hypothetical protein